MVAVVAPEGLAAVEAVCRKWELARRRRSARSPTRASCARSSTARRSARSRSSSSPTRRRATASRPPRGRSRSRSSTSRRRSGATSCSRCSARPNVRSRRHVFERYDHLVGSRTVRRPGLDAAVLRLRPSLRGIAVSLDGPGARRVARPARRRGARRLRGRTQRRVRRRAAAGGHRLPQLREPREARDRLGARRGDRGHGARVRGARHPGRLRATSRSTTRRTAARSRRRRSSAAWALVADVRAVPGAWREGDVVLLAGGDQVALDGSEYQACCSAARPDGRRRPTTSPRPRSSTSSGARRRVLSAAHDVSDGGLAVALAELALHSGIGAELELERDALDWFGEGVGPGGRRVPAGARGGAGGSPAPPARRRRRREAARRPARRPAGRPRGRRALDVRHRRHPRARPRRRPALLLRPLRAPAPRPGVGRDRRLRRGRG